MKILLTGLFASLVLLAPKVSFADLVAYYSFDSDFSDGSGNGNHLTTASGTPNITANAGEKVFGDGALNLTSGDNEYLSLGTNTLTFDATAAWSVSFWAKRNAGSDPGMVMGNDGVRNSFIWATDAFNGLRFRPESSTSASNDFTAPKDTSFHHYVLVADGTGKLTAYVDNGSAQDIAAANGGTSFTIDSIGYAYNNLAYTFGGQLDEIYIFDEAIDATKVGQLFNNTLVPDTTAPTLASGDIVDDQGGAAVATSALITYTVTFSEDIDEATFEASDFGNAGTADVTIGATIVETTPGVFTVEATPTSTGTLQLQINASAEVFDLAGNPLDTTTAIVDDTTINVVADTVDPTLAASDFVDDFSGGPVAQDVLVTYTVTFSEDMDEATVEAGDFGNAGSSTFTLGAITETSPGVFTVEVTPTSAGTLQLQVLASSVLSDPAGNDLDTTSAIADDTTITVISDNTPPTLTGSDIVDDFAGGPVAQGNLVTYTVTFSEDMEASTITDSDFGNAGSATFSIGTITETSPGVFSVEVTPTSLGTLQLQVNQGAVLSDLAGNDLDTTSAILDDTILSVEDLEPNLLAYYPFDGDYLDASGNGNHATPVDATTIGNSGIKTTPGASVFGGGAYFNAEQGDFVDIPDQVFANGDSWSVSMWSRKANSDATGMLIGDRGDTNNFLWNTSNFSGLRLRNSDGTTADKTAPNDTAWHHWVFVADGAAGTVTVYLDNTVLVPAFAFATGFEFREIADAYSSLNYAFIGEIDEVYIYGTAIDTAKVNQLYTNTFGPDTTAPTLVGIVDNRAGGPVEPGSLVTYTVSFNEDMDDSTVDASDFSNAGSIVSYTIGTVTKTSPGVFSVPVTPNADGSLQLQINQSAVLSDPAGNDLDTATAILDDTTITVETDNTDPTLASGDIADDQSGGGPVTQGTTVTYTITFSEDIDDATVTAGDFGNEGTADITIGSITEVSPGVFEVQVTPDTSGTLQLKVLSGAEIADAAGNLLDTSSAIVSSAVITVQEGFSPAGVKHLKVVFVAGQSNADGRAAPSGLPTSPVNLQLPQEDVDFFYRVEGTIYPLTTLRPGLSETSGFGPAVTCGRHLADELADGLTTRVAVIKYANGGTNLYSQWVAGGDGTTSGDGSQYVRFQETVTAGLAALSSTYPNAVLEQLGMVWLQGESDAGSTSTAAAYETNLTNFIADLRLTYGADLRFVVIRLSDNQTSINATNLATIRAAQTAVAAADPLTGMVDSDGFSMKSDNLHFDATGQQSNGHGAAIELLNFQPFLSPATIVAQPGGDFDFSVDDAFDGFDYTLQKNPGLQPEGWDDVETKTASGNTVDFSYTPLAGEEDKQFFRVTRTKP